MIQKSSVHSDQQDLLQLDDSANDQQWHTVISHKGQRKGTTSRRETTDESQTTNKTIKVTSTDFGKYFSFLYMNVMCYARFCL